MPGKRKSRKWHEVNTVKKLNQKQLDEILRAHKAWLNDEPDGVQANLSGTDLRGLPRRNGFAQDKLPPRELGGQRPFGRIDAEGKPQRGKSFRGES